MVRLPLSLAIALFFATSCLAEPMPVITQDTVPLFAIDVDKLPDAKNDMASAALVGFDLHFHTLAKATLTGLYGR